MAPTENNFPPRGPKIVLGRRLLESREWRVSVERIEHKREYRVPVLARALEILVKGGENSMGSEWVCPSPGGWVLSGLDCSDLLRELAFEFLVPMAARSGDALPICSQFRERSYRSGSREG